MVMSSGLLLIIAAFVLHHVESISHPSDNTKNHEFHTASTKEMSVTNSNNMALVLYDDKNVSPFHRKEREFQFGKHKLVISQQWKEVGVAAVVWDAAVVLGNYLVENSQLVEGLKVLELGAGTGLAGIVAAKLGGQVILTDRKIALDSLRENVALNFDDSKQRNIQVEELEWGLNHHTYTDNFDVILGADIVYIEETFDLLLETLKFLTKENTLILLSSKLRYERDTKFHKMFKKEFSVETLHTDQERDIHIYGARQKHIK